MNPKKIKPLTSKSEKVGEDWNWNLFSGEKEGDCLGVQFSDHLNAEDYKEVIVLKFDEDENYEVDYLYKSQAGK